VKLRPTYAPNLSVLPSPTSTAVPIGGAKAYHQHPTTLAPRSCVCPTRPHSNWSMSIRHARLAGPSSASALAVRGDWSTATPCNALPRQQQQHLDFSISCSWAVGLSGARSRPYRGRRLSTARECQLDFTHAIWPQAGIIKLPPPFPPSRHRDPRWGHFRGAVANECSPLWHRFEHPHELLAV
jgi:hypothetical protein